MTFASELVRGVKWSAVSRYGEHGIAFITTAILARLLTPEDFGLLGLAVMVTGFLLVVGELGTATALVQRESLSERLTHSVFWLNLVAGALLAALVYLTAPRIGGFFGEAELVPIVRVVSVSLLFSALSTVPSATLTRDLAFDRLARAQLTAAFVGGVTGVGMALGGYGVWSLVAQHLARTATEAAMTLRVSGYRPAAVFDLGEVRSVAGFGLNLSGFAVLSFALRNIDNLLIGRYLGTTALGYYDIAWRLIEYPKTALAGVVGRVLLPAYSRLQSDDARLGQAFLQVCAAIALVSVPVMLGMMAVAEPLVLVLFGDQWLPAALLVMILAPVGLAQSVGSTAGNIYIAKGRTGWMLLWGLFAGTVGATGIAAGLLWGLVGVAAARLVTNTLLSPINFAIVLRLVGLRLRHLARALWPVLRAGCLMMGAVIAVRLGLRTLDPAPILDLTAAVAAGAAAYLGALWWIRPPILDDVLALFGGRAAAPATRVGPA